MVDFADLSKINALYAEAGQIDRGLENLKDGRITSMTISPPPLMPPTLPEPPGATGGTGATGATAPEPPPMPPVIEPRFMAVVDTSNLLYPPQMVDGITQQLRARRAEIDRELTAFGITVPPAQAQPQAARAARPAPAR